MYRKSPSTIVGAGFAGFALLLAGLSFTVASGGQERMDGKSLFLKRCGGCHALDRDKEGPPLGGVYGRTAGTVDSFQYSDALKKSKIVWSDATLDRWLTDTEKVVPGNDMTFHVEKPEERNEIIAFLKQSPGK
jgi:cytochrome c